MSDARIEAAAKAMIEITLPEHFEKYGPDKLTYNWTGNEVWNCDFLDMAEAALKAADTLDTEKQELIDCLLFYADRESYDPSIWDDGDCFCPVDEDGGQRARNILAKHGGKS
jgi:hypothetical protein